MTGGVDEQPDQVAGRSRSSRWLWVGVAGLALVGLWLLVPALSSGDTVRTEVGQPPPGTPVPTTAATTAAPSSTEPSAAESLAGEGTTPSDSFPQSGTAGPGTDGPAAGGESVSGGTATDTPTANAATDPDPTAGPDRGDWQSVARRFAAEFARPGPDWHDRVADLSGPALAEQLALTDPRTVPEAELVDVEPLTTGEAVATARVVYDDGLALWLRLDLQLDPRSDPAPTGGDAPLVWAVTGVEPTA